MIDEDLEYQCSVMVQGANDQHPAYGATIPMRCVTPAKFETKEGVLLCETCWKVMKDGQRIQYSTAYSKEKQTETLTRTKRLDK